MWFPEGSNLAPADLHSAALTDELENHGRACGIRTCGLTAPDGALYQTELKPDSGPPRIRTGKPSPCKGVALPIGASSPRAARPGATGSQGRPRGRGCARRWACLVLWVFRCGIVNTQARSPPQGGAPHGRQESNLQPLVF